MGRFLLVLLRLEEELLRLVMCFLVLERFGFASFRRRLEAFREEDEEAWTFARRVRFRVIFRESAMSLSLPLPELELALELQPLDDAGGLLSESEVELSSLLSAALLLLLLLLPDGVGCRRLVGFRLRSGAIAT